MSKKTPKVVNQDITAKAVELNSASRVLQRIDQLERQVDHQTSVLKTFFDNEAALKVMKKHAKKLEPNEPVWTVFNTLQVINTIIIGMILAMSFMG